MSNQETKPLAADPYAHQPDGEWKVKRQQDDKEMLCRVLTMEPTSVREASGQYEGREEELFRFLFAMRFLDRVNRVELKEEASILRVLSVVFAIEGIAPDNLNNCQRLTTFLARYLDQHEKQKLLDGYLFTPSYPLGGQPGNERHLMFDQAEADTKLRRQELREAGSESCRPRQGGSCFCSQWLRAQDSTVLDSLIIQFGERLYNMRCAVVHDATPVIFGEVGDPKPPDTASWSFTLLDAYSIRGGQYVNYRTGLLVPDTIVILMNGIRRCFQDGSRFFGCSGVPSELPRKKVRRTGAHR